MGGLVLSASAHTDTRGTVRVRWCGVEQALDAHTHKRLCTQPTAARATL